jgi:hypothetical protein
VPKPKEFFSARPDGLLGVVLGISSRLAWPRFENESGEQVFETEKGKQRAIVIVSEVPLADYKPPEGVERRGTLKSNEQCRVWKETREIIEDSVIGTTSWKEGLAEGLRWVLENRLRLRMTKLVEPGK